MNITTNAILYKRLNQRLHLQDAQALAWENTDRAYLRKLTTLLHSEEKRVADNAVWILTFVSRDKEKQKALVPYLQELSELSMQTKNDSMQRMLLTILHDMPATKATINTAFLNFCLEKSSAPTTPTGIRMLCIKLAYRHCVLYPELLSELVTILQLMDREMLSPGVACVRRKILNKHNI